MMEHYVTLFDYSFAPQGLALHQSLERHAGRFTLWVICMDGKVERALEDLQLPNVRTISLGMVENEELLSVKPDRTHGEYCWTLTPFSFDAVFAADSSVQRVTYVDADVWLTRDPTPIFYEFAVSGAAVQITEHAYSPEYDQTPASGRYCVQFLTMSRDTSSLIRRWWQDRCIEWCFARHEDGKFGDQKYLDDWPERFGSSVHVASERGWFQGPWNANRFPYSEARMYHFHSLRTLPGGRVRLASVGYGLPSPHLDNVYSPYLDDLRTAIGNLSASSADLGWVQLPRFIPPARRRVLQPLRRLRNRILRRLLAPVSDAATRFDRYFVLIANEDRPASL